MSASGLSSSVALADCMPPTAFIDSTHPAIIEQVAQLGVRNLPSGLRAAALFRFVRDEIRYEFMAKLTPEEYVASYVLGTRRGFCVQKAVLLCALSRAADVPCALVLSDLIDHSLSARLTRALGTRTMFHHGLNAFHLQDRWIKVDASLSPDVTARKGYSAVEFDGSSEALLPERTLAGERHASYATFHGLYADLPFDQMMNAFAAEYRDVDLEALAQLGFRP